MSNIINNVNRVIAQSKDLGEERMKICRTCEHFTGSRCKLCGCFMVAKTKIRQARCPAGKW